MVVGSGVGANVVGDKLSERTGVFVSGTIGVNVRKKTGDGVGAGVVGA